jgi:hypothetical protein
LSAAKRRDHVTFDTVRELALRLPGVQDGTSYGTAALKVGKALMVRLKEDGETLVVKTDHAQRDLLMRSAPETFFVTDHYRDHPWVLVRLASVGELELTELLRDAWELAQPKHSRRARAR